MTSVTREQAQAALKYINSQFIVWDNDGDEEHLATLAAFLTEPWQAIETAPTDGSVKSMLLLVEHRFLPHLNKQPETAYAIGMLHNEEWYSPTGGKPIAWMPLPAPPSTKGSE